MPPLSSSSPPNSSPSASANPADPYEQDNAVPLQPKKADYVAGRRNDPAVRQAVAALKKHFTNAREKPIQTPFFIKQLQVLYEADFFPWVIADALKILEQDSFLYSIRSQNIPDFTKLRNVPKIKFYVNAKAVAERGGKAAMAAANAELDRIKNRCLNISRVVNNYSNPRVTGNLGKHQEDLISHELRAQQFDIVGCHTNRYQGRKWIRSDANLDIIAEHRSGKLTIGVEAKNTLSIIPKEEIDEKIAICRHLGITPVFAVRWIKPYINYIERNGGFCWVFKTQIYPRGYEDIVNETYARLSFPERKDSRGHKLEFPVSIRGRLPEASIKIFDRWVAGRISSS